MPTEAWLAAVVLVPLFVAAALLVRPLGALAERLAPLGALPALLAALLAGDGPVTYPGLLLGTILRLGPITRPLLLLVGLVWLAAGLYALAYLANDPRRRAFLGWWSLALAGNAGLVVAGDAASFYLLFALMSFASYGLVVHEGTAAAVRAGRVYLGLVIAGEVFVFAALALAAAAAGTTDLAAFPAALAAAPTGRLAVACALVGFGVKAGALGLHVWLPLAHPEAPTPASAVLSAAMVKAGLLGWLLFIPAGGLPPAGRVLLVLGLAGAFYAVAVGLTQRHPKAILAYSTVSQMGVLAAGTGAALAGAPGLAEAVLPAYAVHHGLAKAALFLGAGLAPGGGRLGRAAVVALGLPALALAAAPFTSGALTKGALKALVSASGAGGEAVPVLLTLSSVGSTVLLVHLLRRLWEVAGPTADAGQAGHAAHQAGAGEALPFAALLLAVAAFPFVEAGPATLLATAAKDLWPVALGLGLSLAFWRFPLPQLPAGDVLALYQRVGERLWRPVVPAPRPPSDGWATWKAALSDWAGEAEGRLRSAGGRGLLLALLLAALQAVLLSGGWSAS